MKLSELNGYNVVATSPRTQSQPNRQTGTFQKVLNAGTAVSNFVGAKGVANEYGATGAELALRLKGQKDVAQNVDYPSGREVLGSAIQTGALLLPGASPAASLATKVGVGATTGYALDVGSQLQDESKSTPEALVPGVGTVVGGSIPLATEGVKYAGRLVSRLFKGLGAGVSGVPQKTIEQIVNNPDIAQKATDKIAKQGNAKVLEENARQIVDGVSKIRQEARTSFGEALGSLKAEDIDPITYRRSLQPVLDSFGVVQTGNKITLDNVEFTNPNNIKKAQALVNELSSTNLDGYSLRKLMNKIENSGYKKAVTEEGFAFNSFLNELRQGVSDAISASTDKLGEINAKFSQDMQLAEAVQNIFGKVKFKNLPEVVRASQKLESLAAQKGIAPEVVDSFLTRIGVSQGEFKTTEAVRSLVNKVGGNNAKGLSWGEITQSLTSSIVPPPVVNRLSIITGLTREKLSPFLSSLRDVSPSVQKLLIDALLQADKSQ